MVLDRVADLHVPLIAPLVSLTRLSCARLVLVTPAIPITIGPIAIAVITIWPVTIAVIRVGWVGIAGVAITIIRVITTAIGTSILSSPIGNLFNGCIAFG